MWSLESALVAQEQFLEEAQLMKARRPEESPQAARSSQLGRMFSAASVQIQVAGGGGDAIHSREGTGDQSTGMDAFAERFRALRHAVDARGLQWRLALERHKTENLSLELDMRRRYSEELE